MTGPDHSVNEHDRERRPSVLFFGRRGCGGTEAALAQLNRLQFDVTQILSAGRGEQIPEEILRWEGDYILCFRSFFILRENLLKRARVAAINFHPAPPEYPGSGCINFALYDECETYGVTAHVMNKKVDNGKILDCRRFPVHRADTLTSVLARTHDQLKILFLDFVTNLANRGESFIDECLQKSADITWRGEARRMAEFERMKVVDPSVSEDELLRIIRATYIENYPPKVILHGFEFLLASDKKGTG